MAFEGLSSKLQSTFKKLTGKGKLSEKDVKRCHTGSEACPARKPT